MDGTKFTNTIPLWYGNKDSPSILHIYFGTPDYCNLNEWPFEFRFALKSKRVEG